MIRPKVSLSNDIVYDWASGLTSSPTLFLGNARAVEQAERAAAAAAARETNSRNVNAMEAMLAEDQAAA
jgi:hypothetical protein